MPEKQESRENPRCEPRGDVDDLIFADEDYQPSAR